MCKYCDADYMTNPQNDASELEVGNFNIDLGILGSATVSLYVEDGQPSVVIFDDEDSGIMAESSLDSFKYCPMCGRKLR